MRLSGEVIGGAKAEVEIGDQSLFCLCFSFFSFSSTGAGSISAIRARPDIVAGTGHRLFLLLWCTHHLLYLFPPLHYPQSNIGINQLIERTSIPSSTLLLTLNQHTSLRKCSSEDVMVIVMP